MNPAHDPGAPIASQQRTPIVTPSPVPSDIIIGTSVETPRTPSMLKRISWGAVFAGAVVAICTQLMLNVLGLAIGLQMFEPFSGTPTASGLGLGTVIWMVVSSILSLFVGGWVAGRLAGIPRSSDGMLHGVVTWSVATLATFYLISSGVSALAGGAMSVFRAGGQAVAAVAPDVDMQTIQQMLPPGVQQELNRIANTQQGQELDPEFKQAVSRVLRTGEVSQQDRIALQDMLVSRGYVANHQEAEQKITSLEQQYHDTKADVALGAEKASEKLSGAAFGLFFALLLGSGAAALGGAAGRPREYLGNVITPAPNAAVRP